MKSLDSNVETSKPSRLFTPRRMLSGMAAVAAAVYTDMRFIEPNWVGIGRHRVPILPPGSAPIRIVQFELIGLGDLWANDFQPRRLLDPKLDELPRVLMSHNPDTKDQIEKADWDLMLSGHTHGGQLTLPWGSTPFAPVRDKRYVRGLHKWKNHWLHITKGVGSLRNMRLNCFPEISVVELCEMSG